VLERLLSFSIRRRVVVVLLVLIGGLLGVHSLARLPIDAVPDVTNNQVQVNATAPALSPVDVEKQVTFAIETALAGIPGLEYTRSLSRNGFAQVTAVFDDAVDPYFARNQVSERLAEAREGLPPGTEVRLGPLSTGLGEIYMWTVEYEHPGGRGAPMRDGTPGWQTDGAFLTPDGQRLATAFEQAAYLRTVQDWVIRPQLKGVPGLAGVDAIGGYVKQFHVQPDPMKLVSFGLTFGDLIRALEENNVSTGAGYVEHEGEAYLVRAAGRIETPDQIEEIVVGSRRGIPIYVRDVAGVVAGGELRTGSASADGEEVVVGTALMLIGGNSRTVARAVDERMATIARSLPPGVRTRTVLDRTKLVDATIATVQKNLFEGALLVVVVLFALLGHFRAALIAALAIPLSMLLTVTGMVQAKVSGNLMSLGALDFGLIVDGAVIVVENCLRRLGEEQRRLGRVLGLKERLAVVLDASREVRKATTFGEAIIVIVYVPILALSGVEGKLFHPMALTVIFALTAAFVLSLTFVPAMVALLVTGPVRERENALIRAAKAVYAPFLAAGLRHRLAVVVVAVAAFGASLFLFRRLGQEFVPTLDEKDLALHALRIPSTSLEQSTAMQLVVERRLRAFPEVAHVFSKTGTAEMASDPMPPNVSDTFVMLKPEEHWPDPAEGKAALVRRIEAAVRELPGNQYEFTQPIQMRFNELTSGVRSDVAVKVFGDDVAAMQACAESVAAALASVRGSADVQIEQTEGLPVMTIDIERSAIARYGLTVSDVQDVVAAAIGGRGAGLVFEGDRRFELVVRLPDDARRDLDAIRSLPIPLPADPDVEVVSAFEADDLVPRASGGFIPLEALASVRVEEGPNQISRENGKRRIVVQANVRGRDLGSFVEDARRAVEHVPLPVGGWIEWGGQFEHLVAARERLAFVVPACFLLIFVLLYGTFGSVRHALLVFSGVPLGLTGGILALWLRDMPFSISAAVGFIALSGVAVLNGLVIVSFVNQMRARGVELDVALRDGALTRLRPVLTTALVASLGFVPMALATGTGAEVQKPLATVVIGGLVTSTLLTLVVLPALYRMFPGRVETVASASEPATGGAAGEPATAR
jgi:cobalt-zinc-cadmium resistance protein CzcA